MKRLYIAAVAGLCAVGSAGAQDGGTAPTAPVVPPPVLQHGGLTEGHGPFARTTWSPVRSPVAPDASYAAPAGGACGPAGCATGGAHHSCLARAKAWLCFNYSPSDLPRFRPQPYITPIQGLLGCSSAGCGACGTGANGSGNYPVQPPPVLPPPPQMPAPAKPGAPTPPPANTGLMPPRGTQGAAAPSVWSSPSALAPASDFGTSRAPAAPKPGQGSVVPTGYAAPR